MTISREEHCNRVVMFLNKAAISGEEAERMLRDQFDRRSLKYQESEEGEEYSEKMHALFLKLSIVDSLALEVESMVAELFPVESKIGKDTSLIDTPPAFV